MRKRKTRMAFKRRRFAVLFLALALFLSALLEMFAFEPLSVSAASTLTQAKVLELAKNGLSEYVTFYNDVSSNVSTVDNSKILSINDNFWAEETSTVNKIDAEAVEVLGQMGEKSVGQLITFEGEEAPTVSTDDAVSDNPYTGKFDAAYDTDYFLGDYAYDGKTAVITDKTTTYAVGETGAAVADTTTTTTTTSETVYNEDGGKTVTVSDADGNVITVTTTDKNGNVTYSEALDDDGNVTITETSYYEDGSVSSETVTDGGGHVTETRYDEYGNVIYSKTTDEAGTITEIETEYNDPAFDITAYDFTEITSDNTSDYTGKVILTVTTTITSADGTATETIETETITDIPTISSNTSYYRVVFKTQITDSYGTVTGTKQYDVRDYYASYSGTNHYYHDERLYTTVYDGDGTDTTQFQYYYTRYYGQDVYSDATYTSKTNSYEYIDAYIYEKNSTAQYAYRTQYYVRTYYDSTKIEFEGETYYKTEEKTTEYHYSDGTSVTDSVRDITTTPTLADTAYVGGGCLRITVTDYLDEYKDGTAYKRTYVSTAITEHNNVIMNEEDGEPVTTDVTQIAVTTRIYVKNTVAETSFNDANQQSCTSDTTYLYHYTTGEGDVLLYTYQTVYRYTPHTIDGVTQCTNNNVSYLDTADIISSYAPIAYTKTVTGDENYTQGDIEVTTYYKNYSISNPAMTNITFDSVSHHSTRLSVAEGYKVVSYTNASGEDVKYTTFFTETVVPSVSNGSLIITDTITEAVVEFDGVFSLSDEANYLSASGLYYTLEYDNTLAGWYRRYYVSTADQLSALLHFYDGYSGLQRYTAGCVGYSCFAVDGAMYFTNDYIISGLKTTYKTGTDTAYAYVENTVCSNFLYAKAEDVAAAGETGTTYAAKIGVVLLNDLDLGGAALDDEFDAENGVDVMLFTLTTKTKDYVSNVSWRGYANQTVTLDLNGNGYTVYNGFLGHTDGTRSDTYAPNCFLGRVYCRSNSGTETIENYYDRYYSVHDVTFSNMFVGHSYAMFGKSTLCVYMDNVNWTNCIAASVAGVNGEDDNTGAVCLVFSTSYGYAYLRDCTIRDSYLLGNSHSAFFASWNNDNDTGLTVSDTNSDNYKNEVTAYTTYIGDPNPSRTFTMGKIEDNIYVTDTETQNDYTNGDGTYTLEPAGYYYYEIPEEDSYRLTDASGSLLTALEAVEAQWKGKTVYDEARESAYTLKSTNYPCIYENCAVVDSTSYDIGSEHSGTFMACFQSGIICTNCFSNSTLYMYRQGGVFLGASLSAKNGFFYPYDDEEGRDFYSGVFIGCYTSGSVEGSTRIGGFVGMIFDDARALSRSIKWGETSTSRATSYRGVCLFDNCYSTSSVGMEYSGTGVGGFAGVVAPSICADPLISGTQHIFRNCYAAGEVGGITTETTLAADTDNTIGGFFGSYANADVSENETYDSIGEIVLTSSNKKYTYEMADYTAPVNAEGSNNTVVSMSNCYYDKQTTAMRERDVGNGLNAYHAYQNDTSTRYYYYYAGATTTKINDYYALNNTLDGLTGVYTKASEAKGVLGLTDSGTAALFGEEADAVWTDAEEYYPILTAFINGTYAYSDGTDRADVINNMHYERQQLYYNCAYASAAAVFLEHYDTALDTDGTEMEADETVYDTVRDITSKFTFTSSTASEGTDITWATDMERNAVKGYVSKLGVTEETDEGGFSLGFSHEDGVSSESGYEIDYNPSVLTISEVDGVYKCLDFAPGKQWVKLQFGTLTEDGGIEEDTVGDRNLRLLPTAYLNAGGILNINVLVDEDGGYENTVTLNAEDEDGNTTTVTLDRFNHSVGVAYAITDRTRQGTDAIYRSQTLTEYGENTENDTASFAFYGGYLLTGNSSAIYLNEETGEMWEQQFTNTVENDSTDGSTMVRVFNTEIVHVDPEDDTSDFSLEMGEEIEYTPENLAKWQGEEFFEITDAGYYYMVYYWRLNDGRYLSDTKLVRITASGYSVELVTGILGEEHTISTSTDFDEVETASTAIDQYVSNYSNGVWEKAYPTKQSDFIIGDGEYATDAYYNHYNEASDYGGSLYYTKSVSTAFASNQSAVAGWKRSSEYKLVTLIVEAQDGDGTWHEMALVDGSVTDISFEGATYTYTFTGYSVSQDPETKLFSITQSQNAVKEFKVESDTQEVSVDGVSRYIVFSFISDAADDFSAVENNLRVTALFREYSADVEAEKYVLLEDSGDAADEAAADDTDGYGFVSMQERDADREVNCSTDSAVLGETEDESRTAVLGGDTLTYRVKLENIGYLDASTVNVSDTVPEGCTYIDGSMKLYKQEKLLSADSEEVYYAQPTVAAWIDESGTQQLDDGFTYTMTEPNEENGGLLTWYLSGLPMDCDYYAEYQVTVDDISPSAWRRILDNTAEWDFLSINGDMMENGTDSTHSIAQYMKYFIFYMRTLVEETNADGTQNRMFQINFQRNQTSGDSDTAYTDIDFKYTFPEGFAYDQEKEIILYKLSYGKDGEEILTPVAKWDESGKAVYYDTDGETVIEAEEAGVTISLDGGSSEGNIAIKINRLEADDVYRVRFYGTQQSLGYGDDNVQEISTGAKIAYKLESDETENSDNTALYGASVTKVERITNQVETDVTHLYLNVEKTVASYDPAQSFLFRIDRFASEEEAEEGTDPLETFYTELHCTAEAEDSAGNTVYQGNRLVQVDKRGYYVVTELTDWSATDYDSGEIASVGLALPEQKYSYSSGAFASILGTGLLDGIYPTAEFYNPESIYAYLSGQSYAENAILFPESAE